MQAFSLLEKRNLGKFLQFCLDLHTAQMGGDVESRNEEGLGQSRSLTRPQNKAQVSNYKYEPEKPFQEFLQCVVGARRRVVRYQ